MDDMVDGVTHKIRTAAAFFENQMPYYIDRGLASPFVPRSPLRRECARIGIGLVIVVIWVLVLGGLIAVCTKTQCDDCIVTFFGSIALLALIVLVRAGPAYCCYCCVRS
jgi:hypothetical protein